MLPRWKFSKQSQKELEEFIYIAKTNPNKKPTKTLLRNVLPQLPLSEYEHNHTETEIITIEDDPMEPSGSIQQSFNQNQLETSLLNLTIAEEDTSIKDFLEYLIECLNNNNALSQTDIDRLSELNEIKIQELLTTLNNNVTHSGLTKLGESLSKNSKYTSISLVEHYCKTVLLDKIVNSDTIQAFKLLLFDFIKIFPDVTRKNVLLPMLIDDYQCLNVYQMILTNLIDVEKEQLLRDFVFVSNDLKQFQLPMIQPLVQLSMDASVKRRLIDLMSVSADRFSGEKQFMKILIDVIKNLESSFSDQESVIFDIIEKNKTILKTIAGKMMRDWVDNNSNE